jgi:hypothetical protein
MNDISRPVKATGTVPQVVHLLRFVLDLAQDQAARDRFRTDPAAVLATELDDAEALTGEDVVAVAHAARDRLPARQATLIHLPGTPRPAGAEAPRDAAVRLLVGLCDALDGPAIEPVTLPHRELRPDPPPPRQVARGGGAPVPTEPPGGRGLYPVIPDEATDA